MSAQSKLESAKDKLETAIELIIEAVKENQTLKDYYGYTLHQAKEHAGEAACKIEKILEHEGENWNNSGKPIDE